MRTIYGLENVGKEWPPTTVCIGVFDGVHLGHQAVIRTAVNDARSNARPCAVLTFDRHPMTLLRPEKAPKAILALDRKLAKMARMEVDVCVIAPFTREFANQTPEEFVEHVLVCVLRAAKVVVGHDFAFGKNRAGTPEWLANRIPTEVLEPFETDGHRVSSTEIRNAVTQGKVEHVAKLLGEAFEIAGLCVPGQKLGADMGIPTANIVSTVEQVLPGNGIYAGYVRTPSGRYMAAIGIGDRPTIPGAGFAVEAHLLDYGGNALYGRDVIIEVWARLRDEIRFESKEALFEQMQKDVEETRSKLEGIGAT